MKNLLLYLVSLLVVLSFGSCNTIRENTNTRTKIIQVKTTAYTHSESDHIKYGRKAANGERLVKGSAAADWSIFPLGTILRIQGFTYEISDYGSALIKKEGEVPVIDIYMTSKAAMNQYGAKFIGVEIIKMGCFYESKKILAERRKFGHCNIMLNRINKKLN